MAIYDSLPYTNFHELNADWLLKQMKEAKAKVDDIQAEIDQFNEDYAALAAAFTIAGSNISTTKNFSAASLTGPLTGNVTGNLTGNVTGDVTGDLTGNAATADKSDMAYALKDYWPTGDTLDNAIPDDDSQLTKIYIGKGLGGRPSDLNSNANIVCMVTHTSTISGSKKYQQILWNDQDQHTYYRVITVASDNTKSYTSWTVEVPAEALHATSADSATTATSATNATNATNAVSANSVLGSPGISSSDLDYAYSTTDRVSFHRFLSTASNRPSAMSQGLVMTFTNNLSGNTVVTQYAFGIYPMGGGADGTCIASRYGTCTGEDKNPQDDTFTWTPWTKLAPSGS